MPRSKSDLEIARKTRELVALDQAHIQNEQARDAFVGLGHTALLAASISFVGNVVPLNGAVLLPILLISWICGVTGLLALTFSFEAATRAINKRRQLINEIDQPNATFAEFLNKIALWTFAAALITVFVFVSANVVFPMSSSEKRPSVPQVSTHGMVPPPRSPAVTPSPTPGTGVIPPPQAPAVTPPPSPKK